MPSSPYEPSASTLYADFMVRKERGEDVELQELCERHPELAEELRRKQALYEEFAPLAEKLRSSNGAADTSSQEIRLAAKEAEQRARTTRIVDPTFAENTRVFYQSRIRLLTLVPIVVMPISLVVALLDSDHRITFPSSSIAVLSCSILAATGAHIWLRLREVSSRVLALIDGLLTQILFFSLLFHVWRVHDFTSPECVLAVALLTHIILTRAAFVPSTALRTLAISAPAPLTLLWIDGSLGFESVLGGAAYEHAVAYEALAQLCLWTAVGVACLSSHINLGLRLRTWEAERIGKYELHERIGRGGMGEVFRATHTLLKRPTAVKFMHPGLSGSETLRRFEKEVKKTSLLNHANIVSVYDYGTTAEGVFYYAMELLEGEDLRALVERSGPLSPERAVDVLVQSCDALHHAHEHGLVHRDVKPANILLTRAGRHDETVKLLDFGLVKTLEERSEDLTTPGHAVGTPETMAPETWEGDRVDPRSDLYSLAAVGYYLVTGRPVFSAPSPRQLWTKHLREIPIPPSRWTPEVPTCLEDVLLRGLEKQPDSRFPDALAMRDALLRCKAQIATEP